MQQREQKRTAATVTRGLRRVTQLVPGAESGSARGRHGGARRQSAPLACDPQLGAIVAAQSTPHARPRPQPHHRPPTPASAAPPQQPSASVLSLLLSFRQPAHWGPGAEARVPQRRTRPRPGAKAPSGQGHKAARAWGCARQGPGPGPAGRAKLTGPAATFVDGCVTSPNRMPCRPPVLQSSVCGW
jgi:hypothetical protein